MSAEDSNPSPPNLQQLNDRIKEVESEQQQIKTDLIRQEHRLIPSLQNFYKVYREKDNGSQEQKERRLSALLAIADILWRRRGAAMLVASVGGLIGGTIALFTLFEFRRQNNTMLEQTTLMQGQNEQILTQNQLFQDQNRQQLVATNGQMVSNLINDLYNAKINEGIHSDSVWEVPKPLVFRILTVSNALVPYDSMNTNRLLSRERGELLQALVSMNVKFPLDPDPNFSNTNLIRAKFYQANLRSVNLYNSDLRGADLRGADLAFANLSNTDNFGNRLDSANLVGAILIDANLGNAYLRDANLQDALLENAKLFSAVIEDADLRGADLRYADLWRADLSGAHLFGARLSSAIIDLRC